VGGDSCAAGVVFRTWRAWARLDDAAWLNSCRADRLSASFWALDLAGMRKRARSRVVRLAWRVRRVSEQVLRTGRWRFQSSTWPFRVWAICRSASLGRREMRGAVGSMMKDVLGSLVGLGSEVVLVV